MLYCSVQERDTSETVSNCPVPTLSSDHSRPSEEEERNRENERVKVKLKSCFHPQILLLRSLHAKGYKSMCIRS